MLGLYFAAVLSVTDGDTFKARVAVWPGIEAVVSVRLAGIDTPELAGACVEEKVKARAARDRLAALLAAGRISLRDVRPDKYAGRVDAIVLVNGQPVADVLVREGHARPYTGGARQSWCP